MFSQAAHDRPLTHNQAGLNRSQQLVTAKRNHINALLDKLADEIELQQVKEVLELYQNTQIVRRFGTRSLILFVAGFAFVVTFIETFNKFLDYIWRMLGGRVS